MPRVVRIPGLKEPLTFPTGTPTEDIYAAIADRLFPVEEAPPPPKEAPSFFQAFGEGATTLGNVPEALRYLYEPSATTRKEAAATTESPYEFQQVSDIGGVGDVGRFVKEQAGQAAGFIAAPVAASMTAARLAPGATKPVAAAAAFLGTAGAQYLSNTAGRQAAEQEKRVKEGKAPEMPEVTKMLLTSAGQAGLDYAGFRLFKPLGELIGLGGKEMVTKQANDILETAIEEGAEAAAKKLVGKQSVLKGAAYGAAIEAAQEPIQQLLERYGAGLELDSDEAIKEYFESAIAGGLLGAPIGGVSTAMSNYQNDAYSKDTLKNLADAIRGGKDPKTEWNKGGRKAVREEATPVPIVDEEGNVITITPEFLSTLGVNPSAKSIMGTPIENIIGQPANNPDVAKIFVKFFNKQLNETSEAIQRKDITDEERADLVTLHSQLATGLKTFTQQRDKAAVEKAKATKAAKAAATAGVTPEVKPTPDDALAVLESDIQKSFGDDAGRVFDLADELMSKGVVTDRAAALAQATKEVAKQKAADVQAAAETEVETAVVPEPTETVKESADKIAEQEAAKAEETVTPQPEVGFKTAKGSLYSVDEQGKTARTKLSEGKGKGKTYEPHSVLYVAPESSKSILEDMQSGSLDQSASIRLGYVENNTFKPVAEVGQIPEGSSPVVAVINNKTNQAIGVYPAKLDPEVGLAPIEKLYKPDGTSSTHVGNRIVEIFGQPTKAQPTPAASVPEEIKVAKSLLKSLEAGGIPLNTAKLNKIGRDLGLDISKKAKPEETIARIKEAVARYDSQSEIVAATPAPAAPAPAPKKTANLQIQGIAEEVRALDADPSSPYSEEFAAYADAIMKMGDVAKATNLQELSKRLKNAYDTRDGRRTGVTQADKNAAFAQIENLYEQIDNATNPLPQTKAEVAQALKQNGNAAEANKISTDIRKDMCD